MPFVNFDTDEVDRLIRFARRVKGLETNMLLEGKDDNDAVKALAQKMSFPTDDCIGLNDCGGIDKLEELSSIAGTLCRLSRKLRKIVLVVDADNHQPKDRAESLRTSLLSHHVGIGPLQLATGSIFRADAGELNIIIKVVGNLDLPFNRHEMEDYAVDLLIMEGKISQNTIQDFKKSSDFLLDYGKKADKIIEESTTGNVQRAYENLINLLNMLARSDDV